MTVPMYLRAISVLCWSSAWAYVGFSLSKLGPLGIAAAVTLFAIHAALLFFRDKWGFGLFYCVFVGASMVQWWRLRHWWEIALGLLGTAWGLAFFLRRRSTLKGPALPQVAEPDI